MEVLKNINYDKELDNSEATHVIVGVLYGGTAIFDFTHSNDAMDKEWSAKGSLKAALEKINPQIADIGAKGSLEYGNDKNESSKQVKCTYTGDYDFTSLPTNLDEAVRACKEIFSETNKTPNVAQKIWLAPLSQLTNKVQSLSADIDENLINQCIKINEQVTSVIAEANDLKKLSEHKGYIPIVQKLVKFLDIVQEQNLNIKKELKNIVWNIKHNKMNESNLTDLLSKVKSQRFRPSSLETWLEKQKNTVASLGAFHEFCVSQNA